MSSSIGRHLRSNVIGYVALFMAMTGLTYAAGLPRDSVKSKQIKDGQVQNADLAAGAVDGSKVAANSLGGPQIDESSLAQVPSAAKADHAASADLATDAGHATNADAAANAQQLGGQSPAAFQQRVTGTCSGGQSVQSIGADGQVGCGAAAGSGTVTNVASGTGLSGGPITSTGTLSVAPSFRLPQSCTNTQVAKSNGAGVWACAADDDIPPNPTSGDLTGSYPNPTLATGSVSGGTAGEIVDDSIKGADVDESSLGTVPDAFELNGKTLLEIAPIRIWQQPTIAGSPSVDLANGLRYAAFCQANYMQLQIETSAPATLNVMSTGSGVDGTIGGTSIPNGAQDVRVATDTSTGADRASVYMSDTTGSATAGLQILINTTAKTYEMDVTLYHVQGANPTCEIFGMARVTSIM